MNLAYGSHSPCQDLPNKGSKEDPIGLAEAQSGIGAPLIIEDAPNPFIGRKETGDRSPQIGRCACQEAGIEWCKEIGCTQKYIPSINVPARDLLNDDVGAR